MRSKLLLLIAIGCVPALAQNSGLFLEPLPGCRSGLGRFRVSWQFPPGTILRILVGETMAPFSGLEPAAGSAETGYWVYEGMPFAAVDSGGAVLSIAHALIDCEGVGGIFDGTLSRLGWYPLQVGNRWVYRMNSRSITADHVTRTVTRTEEIGGRLYYVVNNPTMYLRADEQGRIWSLDTTPVPAAEKLFLDPSGLGDAVYRVVSMMPSIDTAFGRFPGSLRYEKLAFETERGVYVRGLGLLSYTNDLLAGSSGGFLRGGELVEARIAGKLYFRTSVPSITLASESRMLDVTGHNVRNCAIPCYFVACGLGGADPAGTYKPCFTARMGLEFAPPDSVVELALRDAAGLVRHVTNIPVAIPADSLEYRQIPLYNAPNLPLPIGTYRLGARLLDASGVELAASELKIEIH